MANQQNNVRPSDVSSEANSLSFALKQMLNRATFIELVQVVAVGDKVCTVKPLIAQQKVDGSKIQTTAVENIPYFQLQMGSSAIIIKPQKGDIGILLCCDKDTSNVLKNKAESLAATNFTHSRKNGVYLGGVGLLNNDPNEYIEFTGNGINIVGNIKLTGSLNASGDVTAQGISLHDHTHKGVQTGTGSTSAPQ